MTRPGRGPRIRLTPGSELDPPSRLLDDQEQPGGHPRYPRPSSADRSTDRDTTRPGVRKPRLTPDRAPRRAPQVSYARETLLYQQARWGRLLGWSLAAHGLLLCGVILWPYLRPRPVITLPAVVEVDLLQLEKPKPPPKPAPRPVPKPKPKPKPKPEPAPKPKPAPPPEPAPKPEPKPEPPPPPDPVAVAPEPKPEPEIPPPPPTPEPEPQMAAEVEVIPPALAWYLEQVRRGIWSQWLDPGSLLDLDELARVIVRFELGREGQVVSGPTVLEGSGNALFDQSGVRAVLRAAPFPPMPAEHPDGTLGIRFTFVYGDQTEG